MHDAHQMVPGVSEAARLVGLSVGADVGANPTSNSNASDLLLPLCNLLIAELAQYGLQVAYGGNWQPGGLTESLATLVRTAPVPAGARFNRLRNYLTPTIAKTLSASQRAAADSLVDLTVTESASTEAANPGPTELSLMRRQMANDSIARVAIGGRSQGYQGVVPGVLEEVFWMQVFGKPVLAFTGFGGTTAWLAQPETLAHQRQLWLDAMQANGLLSGTDQALVTSDSMRGITLATVTEPSAAQLALREFLRHTQQT
ncbi:hypothetical protein C7S18_22980 [Ahniella affigens]|uniref:Uncharacterized protein n=1 Tax=Ahniella affigens TaxID=2021234 RepID=A0A2P1PYG2_9GAMM|nr:hypothetical protein [Ahniella affigens]AVP99863.1 hypothetical protein C7S18_22980 [Ahniella affigens]